MNQHMQQSTPAILKQYAGGKTYIPAHAEKAMAAHMEKTMPAHMKEYIEPYMHQQVVAGQQSIRAAQPRPVSPHAPTPNLMRRDHSLGFGEQHNVSVEPKNPEPGSSLAFTPQYQQSGNQPGYSPQSGQPDNGQHDYSFIMNPGPPPKRRLLPRGGSLPQKIALIGGALLILLVIFSLVKGAVSSSRVSPQLVTIVQEQQAMLHVLKNADAHSDNLSDKNRNFAVSAKLSLASEQSRLLQYMKKNGKKVKAKELNQTISKTADTNLEASAKQDSYDRAFEQLMTQQLAAYRRRLVAAGTETAGPKGRQLLASEQQSAALLQKMLEAK
jgi:flagellar basal body-associated protein FliL